MGVERRWPYNFLTVKWEFPVRVILVVCDFAWDTSRFLLGQDFWREKLTGTKIWLEKLTGTLLWVQKSTRTRFREEKSTGRITWVKYLAVTKCCTKLDWNAYLLGNWLRHRAWNFTEIFWSIWEDNFYWGQEKIWLGSFSSKMSTKKFIFHYWDSKKTFQFSLGQWLWLKWPFLLDRVHNTMFSTFVFWHVRLSIEFHTS